MQIFNFVYSRHLLLDAYRFVLSVAKTEIKNDERVTLESTGCCHKFNRAQDKNCIRVLANTGIVSVTAKPHRSERNGVQCREPRRTLAWLAEGHLETTRAAAHVHHTLGLAAAPRRAPRQTAAPNVTSHRVHSPHSPASALSIL